MKNNTKIYFVCPDTKSPTGGIKQLYRHVDILNKNGFNACILHRKKGFRVTWFENQTKVEYSNALFKEIKNSLKEKKNRPLDKKFNQIKNLLNDNILEEDGILVFPEIFGSKLHKIYTNFKKVIFNQNCYYTFDHYGFDFKEDNNPYEDKNTIATIVASNDALEYINFTFPKINTFRLRLGIDDSQFFYSGNKKKQIVFMPRKLKEDVLQVINILKIRDNLKDWVFVPIEGKSESEVATILKESQIFLSFNYTEGFGLPPAEAMACGCIVIGYEGRGGREYFNPDFSYPVLDRDIISFVKEIETVILNFDNNPTAYIEKGKSASKFILNEYSLKNEEKDLIEIWGNILINLK